MEKSLSLSEKLYLLAIHPQKGGIIFWASQKLDFALLGALFLEMFLDKKIEIEHKRIQVIDSKSVNPAHTYLLEKMAKATRPQKITGWMSKFRFSMKHIRRQIKATLVQKRLLRLEEKQFLFIRWKKPFLMDKLVTYKLQSEAENQIFQGPGSEESFVLLSLIKPAGLLRRVVPDKYKRKTARLKMKQFPETSRVSETVVRVTAEVPAAVSAASAAAASGH